jgi:hypothetical protein
MPEVALNNPDVRSLVHEIVAATMPEHVRVDIQMRQTCSPGNLSDHDPHGDPR